MSLRGGRWWLIGLVLLLAMAIPLQASLDATAAGTPDNLERSGFSPQRSLLNFLGGVRQFGAYELYIKTDQIHDTYYGDLAREGELVPYYRIITWLDPHYTGAYYEAAAIIYFQGRADEAIDYAREGVRNNPDSADLHYSLGDLYMAEGRYEEAIPLFEQALQEEPHESSPLLTLHALEVAYEKTGRIQEAIAACGEAIQLLQSYLGQEGLTPEDIQNINAGIQDFMERIERLSQQASAQASPT